MRNSNEIKMALAFVIGAVVSFLVGLYVLGPLFSGNKQPQTASAPTEKAAQAPSGADMHTLVRRDVDSVPEHTTVIVEPITRPPEATPPNPPDTRSDVVQPPTHQPQVQPTIPSPPSPTAEPTPAPSPPPPTPERTAPPEPPTTGERQFRVRAGVFEKPENADQLMALLTQQGYHPFQQEETLPSGAKRYRVYVGAFDDRESAERLKKELADKGFAAFIEEGSSGR